VDLERGFLGELLVAKMARERFFTRVAALVRFEDGQVGERLAALIANVALLDGQMRCGDVDELRSGGRGQFPRQVIRLAGRCGHFHAG